MKLLFHIGLNKAGSTYLQDFFSFNAQRLSAAGILYPGAQLSSGLGGAQSGNATQFALDLGAGDVEKAKKFLFGAVEAARAQTKSSLLLSSESMYHRLIKKTALDAFKTICREAGIGDIHFLIIFRDPVSHAISAFNHRAGAIDLEPFEKWLRGGYEFYEELGLFLSNLAQEKDFRICAVPYSTTGLADAAQEFLRVAGLEKPSKTISNISINCTEAELVRLIAKKEKDIAARARLSLKEISNRDKAPDAYLRSRMQERARACADEHRPDLSRLTAMIGHDAFLPAPHSESSARLFDESGDPYFVLSGAQVFALLDAVASHYERPNIFRRLARRLPAPVKRFIKSLTGTGAG